MNELTTWIHCNNCGMRFQSNVKWSATNCGHILCEICTKKMKDSTCFVCQRVSQVIEVNENLDANMQQFFSPFELFLKKTFETVVKVYTFQLGHRSRLFQTLSQKYAHVKKELINNLNRNKNLVKENKMMKDLMIANQARSFSTSTPATVENNNMRPGNFSDISSITPSASAKRPGYAMRMPSANFISNQMYPSAGMYHRPSPSQQHMSQYNSAGRRVPVPIHRPMSGATDPMRNLNFGKRN